MNIYIFVTLNYFIMPVILSVTYEKIRFFYTFRSVFIEILKVTLVKGSQCSFIFMNTIESPHFVCFVKHNFYTLTVIAVSFEWDNNIIFISVISKLTTYLKSWYVYPFLLQNQTLKWNTGIQYNPQHNVKREREIEKIQNSNGILLGLKFRAYLFCIQSLL